MFRSGLPFNISYVYEPAIIKFKAKISIKDEQTVTEMDKYKTSNSIITKKKPLLYVRGLSLASFTTELKKRRNLHTDKNKILLRKECVFRLLEKGAIYFVT